MRTPTSRSPESRDAALRALAAGLSGIDVEVYAEAGLDPLTPVIGLGDRRCRLGVLGRDPGRQEILHGQPFVGAGGQKVRRALYRALHGAELPDFAASLAVGAHVFWCNTVPYKPIGNKAWPEKVRRAFRPWMADALVHDWDGRDVLCFGKDALLWFADDKAERQRLTAWWSAPEAFHTSTTAQLSAQDGTAATFTLHALPHPSPLNAAWAQAFPGLLDATLDRLGWGPERWALSR